MRVTSFERLVKSVGIPIIGGGTPTKDGGVRNGIGMTTITAITAIMMMVANA